MLAYVACSPNGFGPDSHRSSKCASEFQAILDRIQHGEMILVIDPEGACSRSIEKFIALCPPEYQQYLMELWTEVLRIHNSGGFGFDPILESTCGDCPPLDACFGDPNSTSLEWGVKYSALQGFRATEAWKVIDEAKRCAGRCNSIPDFAAALSRFCRESSTLRLFDGFFSSAHVQHKSNAYYVGLKFLVSCWVECVSAPISELRLEINLVAPWESEDEPLPEDWKTLVKSAIRNRLRDDFKELNIQFVLHSRPEPQNQKKVHARWMLSERTTVNPEFGFDFFSDFPRAKGKAGSYTKVISKSDPVGSAEKHGLTIPGLILTAKPFETTFVREWAELSKGTI